VISEELHRRVLNEVTGDFRALVRFLWLTGCRPGEATGLTAESVDMDTRTIRLKKHKTKHKGKQRVIYPCAEAIEVLTDQIQKYGGTGYLFRGLRGKPLSLQAMTMRFQRVSEKVGVRVCSYSYRHSFVTRALSAGESDTIVAALVGHSSTRMIHVHYSHVSEQSRVLKDAADRIGKGERKD
jgi:integrase